MLSYKAEHKVSEFKGLLTQVKDLREVPDGYTPDSRNWLTLTSGRGIELRRGTKLLGTTRVVGAGGVTGLGVGTRFDGTQVPFFTYACKIKYYDEDDDDTHEVGTDTIPAGADGEDTYIHPYQNIAGAFVYVTSPNSGGFKIPVANPGSAVAQSVTTYRGYLKFGQSRGFLFARNGTTAGNKDLTTLYVSKVDKVALSQYPAQVAGENIGTGDAVSKTFTDTLAQATGARTVMFVTATDGTETFTDNRNGVLVGSAGGTGTINYATGVISVTFAVAPAGAQAITASYYYEDATSGGILDFTISNPAARAAGEGNLFPQFDGGGNLNSVFPLATVFYCFHELKTWQVSIPVDDESGADSVSVNLPYREKMGVKSKRGVHGGEEGVYFINTGDPNSPRFMRLELYSGATQSNIAVPKDLSKFVDFSPYVFDKAVVFEWGDFHILCCQQTRNGATDAFNTLMFVRNRTSGAWDLLENPASCLADHGGTLIAGDPVTNNVFTLFSGFDDDDNYIANYWTSGQGDLGISGIKRFSRFVVEGLIQRPQRYKIQFSFDGGAWVDVATVDGSASYVDRSSSISVGSYTVGSKIIGGGATALANPYRAEFKVQTPKFQYVRVRFEACTLDDEGEPGGGYVSVYSYAFKDIRQKGLRSMPERTATV